MTTRVESRRSMGWTGGAGLLTVLALLLAACAGPDQVPAQEGMVEATQVAAWPPVDLAPGERLRVLATTSIVADVAAAVGGERVTVSALVPRGVDPHAFEPTPQDVAQVSKAHLIAANGFGLEAFLEDLLTNAGGAPVVYVSDGIEPIEAHEDEAGPHADEGEVEPPAGGDAHDEAEKGAEDHPEHGGFDPHTWMDPQGVMAWVANLQSAFTALDPGGRAEYARNAQAYLEQLEALDAEIETLLARLPPESRQLVTDHEEFGYFARRFEFGIVGAVIPASSSAAEPSAQDLAALETAIRSLGVRAVFVSSVVSPALARQVAEDTGVQLVSLYAHSLSAADGPAPTYLEMMRYDARLIAEALAG